MRRRIRTTPRGSLAGPAAAVIRVMGVNSIPQQNNRHSMLVPILMLMWVAVVAAGTTGAVAGDWTLHKMTDAATKTGAVCLVRFQRGLLFPKGVVLHFEGTRLPPI